MTQVVQVDKVAAGEPLAVLPDTHVQRQSALTYRLLQLRRERTLSTQLKINLGGQTTTSALTRAKEMLAPTQDGEEFFPRVGVTQPVEFVSLCVPAEITFPDHPDSQAALVAVDLKSYTEGPEEDTEQSAAIEDSEEAIKQSAAAVPITYSDYGEILAAMRAFVDGRDTTLSAAGLAQFLDLPCVLNLSADGCYTMIHFPNGNQPIATFVQQMNQKFPTTDGSMYIKQTEGSVIVHLDRARLLELGVVYQGVGDRIEVDFPQAQMIAPLHLGNGDNGETGYLFQVGLGESLPSEDILIKLGIASTVKSWLESDIANDLSPEQTLANRVAIWRAAMQQGILHDMRSDMTPLGYTDLAVDTLIGVETEIQEIIKEGKPVGVHKVANFLNSIISARGQAQRAQDVRMRLKAHLSNMGQMVDTEVKLNRIPLADTLDLLMKQSRNNAAIKELIDMGRLKLSLQIDDSTITHDEYRSFEIIDIGMLSFMIINAIRNAMRANSKMLEDDDGDPLDIRIIVEREGQIIWIWAVDNGIGMRTESGDEDTKRILDIKEGRPVKSTLRGTGKALSILGESARIVANTFTLLGIPLPEDGYALRLGHGLCSISGNKYTGLHFAHPFLITSQPKSP